MVDYRFGNISSPLNILDYLGVEAISSNDHKEIQNANGLILPGFEAFERAMRFLKEQKLVEPLNDLVLVRLIPFLGNCLGMQILARRSDEGCEPPFDWMSTDVCKIAVKGSSTLKIPHIGWSETTNSLIRLSLVNHLNYLNSKKLYSKLLNLRHIFRIIPSKSNGFLGHK